MIYKHFAPCALMTGGLGVVGSNPATPTIKIKHLSEWMLPARNIQKRTGSRRRAGGDSAKEPPSTFYHRTGARRRGLDRIGQCRSSRAAAAVTP
ncbi:protein of unknown function [Methylocella tundrae]|uniref:Uncharacterized protein n=2 Tax=Methylocella tundrae TaxID=227605 RepID=A0A4U8YX85_METTU|nr:protein of unknown function [Methylocella tundrae]